MTTPFNIVKQSVLYHWSER